MIDKDNINIFSFAFSEAGNDQIINKNENSAYNPIESHTSDKPVASPTASPAVTRYGRTGQNDKYSYYTKHKTINTMQKKLEYAIKRATKRIEEMEEDEEGEE